jgi:hypothetical protein
MSAHGRHLGARTQIFKGRHFLSSPLPPVKTGAFMLKRYCLQKFV